MEPERWQKIEQLYNSALEIEGSRRAAFLAIACGTDEALREEVASLLARAETGDFLETPALAVAAKAIARVSDARALPAAIGHYRVVRLLGEGGMGAVYEAEQDQPRRVVALKVIKPGFATAETLRRFQHESQALGRLQHPGIAQIYEAGTADTGFGPQPYFAMELIRGQPLHEYAEAHQLDVRQKLGLMTKICDAVDHANRHGVIHRDLKPANILVDETGQPKILDFGVAQVTESDAQHTRQTDLGQIVGTLAYMSPEQALGDPSALDTRCDVYALGVILYELLAGQPPYDIDRKPVHEAVRIVREEEPAHLSSIDRSYRGDVDTIVVKALEKDKSRRYASAADLARDIRRYLADEPIAARSPSASYKLLKFARRHKALVAGTAAVFLVLAAGIVASTLEAVQARTAQHAAVEQRDRATAAEARAEQERNSALAEKRRADAEAATAQAINDFLQNDLLAQASSMKQAGPSTKPDPDLKVRTALDRAAARIAGKFLRQPEVEAAIRDTIGQTYLDLGLASEAQLQFARALDLRRRVLGADNPKTLKTMDHLASVSDPADAEASYKHALAIQQRMLGSEHPDTLSSISGLAEVYAKQGKYKQAEALYRQLLEIRRRVLGAKHLDTLRAMQRLAIVYAHQGKYPQAEAMFSQIVDVWRRVLGAEHPDTLHSIVNLAIVYGLEGKYAEAEPLYNEVLETERRTLGSEHPATMATLNNLAIIHLGRGNYPQAEVLFSQALDIAVRLNGPENNDAQQFRGNLVEAYAADGKYPQAEALVGQILEIQRRNQRADDPVAFYCFSFAAFLYQRQGKYALAETYGAQALAGRRIALGSDHPETIDSAANLALAYQSQGKFTESEPLAREAVEFYKKKQSDDWQRFRAVSLLGASFAGQKKFAEAELLLIQGYQGMVARKDRIAIPDRYYMDRAREWLIQLYEAWGKPEKTAEWRQN